MAGANYMGGKRNTVRAKSKDIIGRVQRRHFRKQRLASALCVTQEIRVHSSATLSSVLPEITLAHARRDASTGSGATSSTRSGDQLYAPTVPSSAPRRNKPSKVLGALDVSDHVSMRAAIDRILQQPNLIGIDAPNHQGTTYTEHLQTPESISRQTNVHLDSKDLVSRHFSDPRLSYFPIPKHGHTDLPESDPGMRYYAAAPGMVSPPDSPLGVCDTAPRDDRQFIEMQLSPGANPFIRTKDGETKWPNTSFTVAHPLPQSSPFPSSSQSSDNSILNLDTSPQSAIRPGRSVELFVEATDCDDASSLHSLPRPISRHRYLIEEEPKVKRSWITWCNATENNDLQCFSSPGLDCIGPLVSQDVTKDDRPIDFLSDPHPWEKIDRILNLKPPEPSAARPAKVVFTRDREGVGYVSSERPSTRDMCPSDTTPFGTEIDAKPTVVRASSANPSALDSEMLTGDTRITIDSPDHRLLFDAGPPIPAEVGPYIHAHPLQDAFSIPGIGYTQNEHRPSSTPLAVVDGTTTAGPDVDVMFNGPCLFGDSDLEEDE